MEVSIASNDFNVPMTSMCQKMKHLYILLFSPFKIKSKNQLILTLAQNDYWNRLRIIGVT